MTAANQGGPDWHPASRETEIRVRDLHKSFGSKKVLRGIDCTIHKGEIIALVGHSGCGKTVLLDHLTGLQQPDSGHVEVTHHGNPRSGLIDITTADSDMMDEIRLHWAVVFQHNALFTGTVHDNIALWLREHTELNERKIRTRVRDALTSVKLDPDEVSGKERDALSGGMAKRVAIARAIAMDPRVIFYDEPTTGLDPVVSGHVHELIWNTHHARPLDNQSQNTPTASRTRTSIIITHDRDLLRRISPRIVMLDGGKVVFDGSYESLRQSEVPVAKKYLAEMPVLHMREG
jgi:phospholipid/cholesterol/gamma-HCH transport system ATP-binding protein